MKIVSSSGDRKITPREFLRKIGGRWRGIDLDPDRAMDGEVEEVWLRLVKSPITFDVTESGALWIGGMSLSRCRGEWLALSISDRPTVAEILELAKQYSGVEYVIAEAYLGSTNDGNGDPCLVEKTDIR
jgi:hypothetical protein